MKSLMNEIKEKAHEEGDRGISGESRIHPILYHACNCLGEVKSSAGAEFRTKDRSCRINQGNPSRTNAITEIFPLFVTRFGYTPSLLRSLLKLFPSLSHT